MLVNQQSLVALGIGCGSSVVNLYSQQPWVKHDIHHTSIDVLKHISTYRVGNLSL